MEKAREMKNSNSFRTLFHQEMLATSMRQLLPVGLAGLFILLMVLAMISTDNTRIYSAAVTLTQDVILPLKKKSFTLEQHVLVLRLVSICIGVIFVICSTFMAQLDYINLFVTIVCSMWLGGCAPVLDFWSLQPFWNDCWSIYFTYSRNGTFPGSNFNQAQLG